MTPHDVDMLLAPDDAERLLPRFCMTPRPGTSDGLFRSALFARCQCHGLPIEFMAGLHIRGHPFRLATREATTTACTTVFVPSRAELIATLHLFGRPKDLARAATLVSS